MSDIIPQQTSGSPKDNVATIEMPETRHAMEHYQTARARLLDVNHWGDMSGFLSASFQLIDQEGKTVRNRLPQTGDYFRIKVPAPSPLNQYDWVRVEKIEEVNESERQMTAIRVRPSRDPLSVDQETQHFFSEEATSSFIVKREGKKILAEVHGRNEQPNVSETESLGSEIRNTIVATGALLGLSDIQWNKLVKGLLKVR
jgi:hypothetical protein